MAEYVAGHEYVREPNGLLETGAVVETHRHNFFHNTHLKKGYWEVHRFEPLLGTDLVQVTGNDQKPLWRPLPLLRVHGGGPRSIVPIPGNMQHKFVLLDGPGFYSCNFCHRHPDGTISETFTGWLDAYR